mgnify:FL=1
MKVWITNHENNAHQVFLDLAFTDRLPNPYVAYFLGESDYRQLIEKHNGELWTDALLKQYSYSIMDAETLEWYAMVQAGDAG